ncbi:hypothetical protein [Fredinandcohnia quinoae]|uniref:Lipoprotein n=1 Tax=Fredinandcohnia quinoae TaxID=2918902 RepID=A0AAW5E7J6_9BACI|nr:hypothetical protein [Fredinandcohnia sp. SECRCQ15]MCH1624759.1 hypothetical protein [Fredinandcohnia sp. SECRCQ15]
MKLTIKFLIIISTIFLLSGCLYPEERLKQNEIPYKDQLATVQSAVDQYQKESNGLLPIKTRDMETPIYQKYPIDFKKISPKYMAEPPGNAYESGGVYIYVLVDVETNPTVKLLDLKITEEIRDLNLRVDIYKSSNEYPPFKDKIDTSVFTLDYKKLGYKEEPFVVSPFTGKNLPLVISNTGEIFIDYRMDLYEYLNKYESKYNKGDDIRDILVNNSMFVPTNSLSYTIDNNNEPIFLIK